jgi:ribonuclease P protein component
MIARTYRLPKNVFSILYKNGKRKYSDNLQCIYIPQKNSYTHFTVVVGKKIHKHAVQRNRMKRIIREAFVHLIPSIQSPIDCLIVVKKDISHLKTQQLEIEIQSILIEISMNDTHI